MIVAKFGGSSVANAEQFKKVAQICRVDENRRVIVVSAPGRQNGHDHKITDMLYLTHQLAALGMGVGEVFDAVAQRYLDIQRDLALDFDLEGELQEIRDALQRGCTKDYAASRGEYLCAQLLANYLGYQFVDAKDYVRFDSEGQYDEAKTLELLQSLKESEPFVMPGFYGATAEKEIVTFSRGGSDITGAILAQGLEAEVYENWTDVSGFLAADPHIVKDPCPIEMVTFREQRELSYMGAPVLHEDTIYPVRRAGIPIHIRNTNDPKAPGTRIVPEADAKAQKKNGVHVVTGIAGRKGFAAVNVEKYRMGEESGFLRKLSSVFEANEIRVDHLPTGIDTVSVVVSEKDLKGKEKKLLEEISIYCGPDRQHIDDGMALVAVVGQGMQWKMGVSARVFSAIAEAGINIRMITQGASELNIIVGVEDADFEKAIEALYDAFF